MLYKGGTMKRRIIAAAIAAVAGSVMASDFAVGINTLSLHSKDGFETVTPGLYVRGTGTVFGEAGAFRNSYGFTTVHVGIGYSYPIGDWDLSIAVGASYGYRERQEWFYPDGSAPNFYTYESPKILPMVMPSVGYRFNEEWGARLFVLPPVKGKADAWCASFAIERYF